MSDDERERKLLKRRNCAKNYRKKNLEYNAMLEEQIRTLKRENEDLRERISALYQEILFNTSRQQFLNNDIQSPSILPRWGELSSVGFVGAPAFLPTQAMIPPQLYTQGRQALPGTIPMHPIHSQNTVTNTSISLNTGADTSRSAVSHGVINIDPLEKKTEERSHEI
jgi:hypothetical protein